MDGLKQIAVVTQGEGWHLVGLDDQGQVWFGTTHRTTKGRSITWALIDAGAEPGPDQASGTQAPVEGPGRQFRHTLARVRPGGLK